MRGQVDVASCRGSREGPTDAPAVLALRARQSRAILATLLLSQGVPMLLGGDEFGRTQGGNNNAWCQGTELSCSRWEEADAELTGFTPRVIQLRKDHPASRRQSFLSGSERLGSGLP